MQLCAAGSVLRPGHILPVQRVRPELQVESPGPVQHSTSNLSGHRSHRPGHYRVRCGCPDGESGKSTLNCM